MKYDKFTTPVKIEIPGIGTIESKDLLLKVEVDEVIAKLNDRIHELENMPHTDNSAVIELLENQNAELRQATRWRKCSEEMPEDDSDVLATDGEEIWLCYKTTMTDGLPWFQPNGQPHIEGVTHWMPLPKAPEVDKIEKEKDPVLNIVQEWMDISGFPKAPEVK